MTATPDVETYLQKFSLTDHSSGEILQFIDRQRFSKHYCILGWQQGSGKTLGAIGWYRRLLQETSIRNVVVVSTALAIHLTWEIKLRDYKESFITIQRLKDFEAIMPGQVILISLNMLKAMFFINKPNEKDQKDQKDQDKKADGQSDEKKDSSE